MGSLARAIGSVGPEVPNLRQGSLDLDLGDVDPVPVGLFLLSSPVISAAMEVEKSLGKMGEGREGRRCGGRLVERHRRPRPPLVGEQQRRPR